MPSSPEDPQEGFEEVETPGPEQGRRGSGGGGGSGGAAETEGEASEWEEALVSEEEEESSEDEDCLVEEEGSEETDSEMELLWGRRPPKRQRTAAAAAAAEAVAPYVYMPPQRAQRTQPCSRDSLLSLLYACPTLIGEGAHHRCNTSGRAASLSIF